MLAWPNGGNYKPLFIGWQRIWDIYQHVENVIKSKEMFKFHFTTYQKLFNILNLDKLSRFVNREVNSL